MAILCLNGVGQLFHVGVTGHRIHPTTFWKCHADPQSRAMVALKSGCVRIWYATRGGACWAISRSEIDAPDHQNRSRRQFDAETGLARFPLGVTNHRIRPIVCGIEMPIVCRDRPKIGSVRSGYVAVGSLVGPLAVPT